MRIKTIRCNKANYNCKIKRKYTDIKAIVLHYTGGTKDTAKNEGDFFSKPCEDYPRSAHFFVDYEGNIVRSLNINRVAWSVGTPSKGVIYNNDNTVSIELCGIADKDISDKQLKALKYLIKRIIKYTGPVAIIRHYDINGKQCPLRYISPKKWEELKRRLLHE